MPSTNRATDSGSEARPSMPGKSYTPGSTMPALPSQDAALRRGPGIQPSANALRAAISVRGSRLPPE